MPALVWKSVFTECRVPPVCSSMLEAGVNGGGDSAVRFFDGAVRLATGTVTGGNAREGIDGVEAGVAAGVPEYVSGTEL